MLQSAIATLSSNTLLPKIEMTQAKVGVRFLLMVEEPKYKAFGERVTQRMQALGLSTGDIKKGVGVSYEMARRYSMGTAFPRQQKLDLLAQTLRCPSGWLAYGAEEAPTEGTELAAIAPWDDSTPLEADEVAIPFFKECQFAAGTGSCHDLEVSSRKLRFAKSTLKAYGIEPEHAACGTANGNSMAPYIPHGAAVGIDLSRTTIIDGETYALEHAGLFRIKYLYRLPGGGLRLRSENSAEHEDESYTAEEVAKDIRVLGWVWWVSSLRRWKG